MAEPRNTCETFFRFEFDEVLILLHYFNTGFVTRLLMWSRWDLTIYLNQFCKFWCFIIFGASIMSCGTDGIILWIVHTFSVYSIYVDDSSNKTFMVIWRNLFANFIIKHFIGFWKLLKFLHITRFNQIIFYLQYNNNAKQVLVKLSNNLKINATTPRPLIKKFYKMICSLK